MTLPSNNKNISPQAPSFYYSFPGFLQGVGGGGGGGDDLTFLRPFKFCEK